MQPRGAARPCLKAGWRGSTQKQQYMVHQRSTASGPSACYAAKFLARQQVRAVPWGHRQPPPMRCSKPSNALKTWTRMGSLSFVTVPRTGRSPAASSWQRSAWQGATVRGLVCGHWISAHRKMKAPSPEDAKCKFCRRHFTARGVKEHERHQCTKSEQTAAQVQEESVPSLWKGSSGPRGPGAPRGIRQIPLGESPSYERDAERQRRCEEGGTQESYETTRGVQSCTALTRGLCGAPGRQRETRAETTERIWEEVRKRTALQTEKRRQEIGVAVNRKRHDTGEVV